MKKLIFIMIFCLLITACTKNTEQLDEVRGARLYEQYGEIIVVATQTDITEYETAETQAIEIEEYAVETIEISATFERGNSASNIQNSGTTAYDGDWIYFTNQSKDLEVDRRLFKMREDGSEKTQLNDDWSFYINVANDWVYYSNWTEDGYIYKVRTDGSERTQINSDQSDYVTLVGDWIYYCIPANKGRDDASGDYGIYKIRTDGTERTCIAAVYCYYLSVYSDLIYYSAGISDGSRIYQDGAYKIRTDGTENTKIIDGAVGGIVTDGGWIYYVGGRSDAVPIAASSIDSAQSGAIYGLYRIPTDINAQAVLLSENDIAYFNVHEDFIFYSNWSDGWNLYRMNTDGSENIKLCDVRALNITVQGDRVYFWSTSTTNCRIRFDGSELEQLY
ncbi:MAG: DUF5050 domain-containing protein [Oscillospiraceae bacterium]|nr:DUF5050 domain-containing protein [Oscillospiraceae bacterium]